jgi:primary-amine oxidase
VAPGVNAQHHQHLFIARLDFAVDDSNGGRDLQVSECNIAACDDGPDNSAGNAFTFTETPLLSESAAQRVLNPLTGRFFKV